VTIHILPDDVFLDMFDYDYFPMSRNVEIAGAGMQKVAAYHFCITRVSAPVTPM
jgi:hypothetical protein